MIVNHIPVRRSFQRTVLRRGPWLAGTLLLWAVSVAGQAPDASVRGVVRSTAGQSLAGARVTASHSDTGLVQTAISDSEGRYSFGSLPRGLYSLTAQREGYQGLEKRGIELAVGARREENFALSPLAAAEGQTEINDVLQVIPPASSLPVETIASSVSVVVEEDRMLQLPLASRNVYSLFLLQPGVTSQGAIGTRGLSFSVHGQRVSGSNYQLDGTDNNNIVLTGPVSATSAEAIQEFRMVNSSFSSENGRATAFVAQVVTRSGTNRFHGSVFEFLGNDKLNANTFQNNAQQIARSPLRHNQFGYSLGGPLRKSRTFFWSGAEFSRLRFGTLRELKVPSATFIASLPADSTARRLLTEIPPYPSTPTATDPNIGEVKFQAPNRIDTILTSQRLDHHFANEKDRLMIRYALASTTEQRNAAAGSGGVGVLSAADIAYPGLVPTDRFRGHNTMVGWTHSFNAGRFNDIRIAWSREGINIPRPRSDLPNLQSLDGVLLPASPRQSELRENNNVIQFSDTFSERRGRSTLTAGFDFRRNLSNSLTLGLQNETFGGNARIPDGLYVFDSLAAFGLDQPFAFSIGVDPLAAGPFQLPDLRRRYRSNEFALFLEDDLRLTPRFSLNIGLRYEYYGVLHSTDRSQDVNFYFGPGAGIDERLANGAPRSTDQNPGDLKGLLYRPDRLNLAPSIGIAWDPFGRGRSVVRAGYAVAFDRVLDTIRDLRSNNLQLVNCISFMGCTPDALRLPAVSMLPILNQSPVVPSPYIVVQLDEHLRTPYAQNWYFGLQQTITPNLLVEIGHAGSVGRKLLSRDVINRRIAGSPRANSQIGDDTFLSSAGSSNYLAMEIGLRRRFSQGLQYQISYTWSHAIDNQSDIFEGVPTDPRTGAFALAGFTRQFDARVDRGNASFDQRHNLVVNAIWDLPKLPVNAAWVNHVFRDWTVSLIGAYRSGFPVTVIADSLLADPATGLLNNRLDFIGAPGQPYNLSHPTSIPGGVQWLDPELFRPAVGHVGNVGRGAIRGPGFWNYDLALLREIAVSEGRRLQFRVEFYNVFNHANLSAPVTTYLSNPFLGTVNPDFGKAYYGLNRNHSRFGDLPLENPSRRVQLGLRIQF
jgi:Carboxypeptidase regulatory-like domain/TonB dependent receptor-like, beta-barrel